jgi:hypothetical protein
VVDEGFYSKEENLIKGRSFPFHLGFAKGTTMDI